MVTAYESKRPNGRSIVFVHGEWAGAWVWEENFMEYFAQRGTLVHFLFFFFLFFLFFSFGLTSSFLVCRF
jgi:hypothetical protein